MSGIDPISVIGSMLVGVLEPPYLTAWIPLYRLGLSVIGSMLVGVLGPPYLTAYVGFEQFKVLLKSMSLSMSNAHFLSMGWPFLRGNFI